MTSSAVCGSMYGILLSIVMFFLMTSPPRGVLAHSDFDTGEFRLATSAIRIARIEEQLNTTRSRLVQLATRSFSDKTLHPQEHDLSAPCPGGVHDIRCGTKCVSDLLICDGIADCLDGTDEKSSLCDGQESLVKSGDVFAGSVHWYRCAMLADHKSTITITHVQRPHAFRARQLIRATMRDYVPFGPVVFHVDGVYNPARRLIEFNAADQHVGVAGDCYFNGRDQLECRVFLQMSGLTCSKAVLFRMK